MGASLAAAWGELAPPVQAAVVTASATCVAAFVGFTAVMLQLRRQARNASRQARETEADKLKLDIYKSIAKACTDAGKQEVMFATALRTAVSALQMAQRPQALPLLRIPPALRVPAMIKLNDDAGTAATDMIRLIEQWQIVDERLDVFQIAINVAQHDRREAWWPLFDASLRVLPHQNPQTGELLPWALPSVVEIAEFQAATSKMIDAGSALGAYVHDFQAEMQNLLLGSLFSHRLPPRKPLDPRYRVVTLDRRVELLKHFDEETAFGRTKAETDRRVLQDLRLQTWERRPDRNAE